MCFCGGGLTFGLLGLLSWAKAGKVEGRAPSGHAAKTGAKTQGKEVPGAPLCFCLAFEKPSLRGGSDCSKEILTSTPEGAG